ncbi:hypothetical protein TNCV_988971 [Trichonephila clavipes]|nr:hypothetical protein TNCV_988971 [Trichonephila clavipes]
MVRDVAARSITVIHVSICHREQWYKELSAISPIGPSIPPASSDNKSKECFFPGIEVKVGITFQDGEQFNSCQVIYSQFVVWQFIKTIIKQGVDSSNGPKTRLPLFPIFISEFT